MYNSRHKDQKKLLLKIMFLIAFLTLGFSPYNFISSSNYLKTTVVVPGTIVGSESHGGGWQRGKDSDNMRELMSASEHPVITYTDQTGNILTFTSSLTVTSLPEGELKIRFSVLDKTKVEVDSFLMRWMWALIPAVAGVFLLFATFTMIIDNKIALIMWVILVIAIPLFLFLTFGESNEMSQQMKQNILVNLNTSYSRLYYNYYEENDNEETKREIGTDGMRIAKWGKQHNIVTDEIYNDLKELIKKSEIIFSDSDGVFILPSE